MSDIYTNETIVMQTKQWLLKVVIEQNFCPFANTEFEKNTIRYAVCSEMQQDAILQSVLDECEFLDSNPGIETTLIIFAKGLKCFNAFLNTIEIADELMAIQGYEGVYQLASFHPDYCFAGLENNDAANYTNRSPYPMLHLIREESLERILENFPNSSEIPERNIKHARQLGVTFFVHTLKQIRQIK